MNDHVAERDRPRTLTQVRHRSHPSRTAPRTISLSPSLSQSFSLARIIDRHHSHHRLRHCLTLAIDLAISTSLSPTLLPSLAIARHRSHYSPSLSSSLASVRTIALAISRPIAHHPLVYHLEPSCASPRTRLPTHSVHSVGFARGAWRGRVRAGSMRCRAAFARGDDCVATTSRCDHFEVRHAFELFELVSSSHHRHRRII